MRQVETALGGGGDDRGVSSPVLPGLGGVVLPFRAPQAADLPRPGEPLLPRLLASLCGETNRARAEAATPWRHEDRRNARAIVYAIVDEIGRRLPEAPRALLDQPLPHPVEVLDRFPLEARTIRVLRRQVATQPRTGTWTVARYLALPQFGGRALLDLLASFERATTTTARSSNERTSIGWRPAESSPVAGAPLAVTRLERVVDLVRRRAPISEAQIAVELGRAEGGGPIDLVRLVRDAARAGQRPPFRVMLLGGARVAVEASRVTTARAAYSIASRCVHYWGAVSIHRVAEQLEATLSTCVEPLFLERLLAALPAFEWLDREAGWFWLTSRSNRVQQALRASLVANTRVSLTGFAAALRDGQAGPDPPPPGVLGRIALALPDVRLEGDSAVLGARPQTAGASIARAAGAPLKSARLSLAAPP